MKEPKSILTLGLFSAALALVLGGCGDDRGDYLSELQFSDAYKAKADTANFVASRWQVVENDEEQIELWIGEQADLDDDELLEEENVATRLTIEAVTTEDGKAVAGYDNINYLVRNDDALGKTKVGLVHVQPGNDDTEATYTFLSLCSKNDEVKAKEVLPKTRNPAVTTDFADACIVVFNDEADPKKVRVRGIHPIYNRAP